MSVVDEVIEIIKGSKGDGFVVEELRNKAFRILRVQMDNRTCFDCGVRNPSWMSLSLGVWLCLECSGEHRSMGVHLTFVRSATLDSFTPVQIIQVAAGGNGRAKEFFRKHGIVGKRKDISSDGLKLDYASAAAAKYRDLLGNEAKRIADENGMGTRAAHPVTVQPRASSVVEPVKAPEPAKEHVPSCVDFSPFSATPVAPVAPVAPTVKVISAAQDPFVAGTVRKAGNAATQKINAKRISSFDFDQFE